ncbi:MAG: Maf family protein [bacterium]
MTSAANSCLILASASPRRLELLQQVGVHPQVRPADIDETVFEGEHAGNYVRRMALKKARVVSALLGDESVTVLGSDTSVVVDDEVLGKPENEAHAAHMLGMLSGRSHQVLSGVALVSAQREEVLLSSTEVRFRTVSEAEMAAYWRSQEPLGKAGGYAIQGLGAMFIEEIRGSYSGVMGLPLFETCQLLRAFGHPVLLLDQENTERRIPNDEY